jgi:hypothetical protein
LNVRFIFKQSRVAGLQTQSVHVQLPAHQMHISLASRVDSQFGVFASVEQARIHQSIGIDRDGAIGASWGTNQAQLPSFLRRRNGFLLIAWFDPGYFRQQPNLQKMCRLVCCMIKLRVDHAGAGTHPLDVARRNRFDVAHADLKERLLENDGHIRSLEEKHAHARDALEHYRQSIKEQRDQDQRRHEQQVQQLQAEIRQLQQDQAVKRDEVTRLNREGAKLVAELSHAKQALYDQQSAGRGQVKQIEQLQALEVQFAGQAAHLLATTDRLADADKRVLELTGQLRDRELALVTAQATLAAQQGITTELRAFLSAAPQDGEPGKVATPVHERQGG